MCVCVRALRQCKYTYIVAPRHGVYHYLITCIRKSTARQLVGNSASFVWTFSFRTCQAMARRSSAWEAVWVQLCKGVSNAVCALISC